MNPRICLIALLIFSSLSSCAFDDSREYRITGISRSAVAKAKRILEEAATEARLRKMMPSKNDSPSPFAFYMNNNVHMRGLISRGEIEIELDRSDWPPPGAFKKAERVLAAQLPKAFGRKFRLEARSPYEKIIVAD